MLGAILLLMAIGADDPKLDQFLSDAANARVATVEKHSEAIKKFRDELKIAEKGAVNTKLAADTITDSGKRIYKSIANRERDVERLKKSIEYAEKRRDAESKLKYEWPKLDTLKMSVGDAGSLDSLKVIQIVDKENMIVKRGDVTMWLNASTDGVADGETFGLSDAYSVTGTRQYVNLVGGTKTVFVLKLYARQEMVK